MAKKLPSDKQLKLSAPDRDALGNFTWEKKIDVATKWLALGNMRLIAELTGMEYNTLAAWKRSDWWPELLDEIRRTRQLETSGKLGKIVDKSLEVISDRLANGDFVWDSKNSELARRPVSMKDANTVTKDLLAHQVKIEELATKMETKQESVQDSLKLLAAEFAKWSRKIVHDRAQDTPFKELSI
jgi:hypothetical protein